MLFHSFSPCESFYDFYDCILLFIIIWDVYSFIWIEYIYIFQLIVDQAILKYILITILQFNLYVVNEKDNDEINI